MLLDLFLVRLFCDLSHVSTLTPDIDIGPSNSVCLSVCLSVRNVPVSDKNGVTYRHKFFFTIR